MLNKNIMNNGYLKVFMICLILGIAIFLPFIIYDKGYFLYYGDYNVQQIPFYTLAHDAVKNGEIFWNWTTDLGTNFIGSYSFYLLMSPFFWLTLLFENSMVAQLLAPLLILKFAFAGLCSYAFIKRFAKSDDFAVIGGILYAYCGFNMYNVFFNHFHESVIIFPLMLIAIEEFVQNNRRGWFALTVCMSALINYFFFAGQAVFLIIYFIIRCFDKSFKITKGKFFLLAFEAVLGFFMSAFILLPSLLMILSNPRTDNFSSGMNLLVYFKPERYGHILQSLFFPPDIPSRSNFFTESNAKWASLSAYIPLFTLTGVFAFVRQHKRHWLNKILIISFIMAFVPVLNSLFYALNSSYYARWFYMPTLMMVLATVLALENIKVKFDFGIKICTFAVVAFSAIGIVPISNDGEFKFFDLPPYPDRFWLYISIAAISLLIVHIILKHRHNKKLFIRLCYGFTCVIVFIYSFAIIFMGKSHGKDYETVVMQGIKGGENISLDESEFFRIDEYEVEDNYSMFWDLPNIQAFHSVVVTSIMDYYIGIGDKRDVASRPPLEFNGVRGLTSVKYLFADPNEEDKPQIAGFEYIDSQNGLDVYENNYFIPMGFTYDYYIDYNSFEDLDDNAKDLVLLKAILLEDEDIDDVSDIINSHKEVPVMMYSDNEYLDDCEDRAQTAGYYFETSTSGFVSKINLPRENLVFYSVPYESGWSAYVNGEEVEIYKANLGFMAVRAEAGENEIVFKYMTPGLIEGLVISAICVIMFTIYLTISFYLRRKKPEKYAVNKYAHKCVFDREIELNNKEAYIKKTLRKIE